MKKQLIYKNERGASGTLEILQLAIIILLIAFLVPLLISKLFLNVKNKNPDYVSESTTSLEDNITDTSPLENSLIKGSSISAYIYYDALDSVYQLNIEDAAIKDDTEKKHYNVSKYFLDVKNLSISMNLRNEIFPNGNSFLDKNKLVLFFGNNVLVFNLDTKTVESAGIISVFGCPGCYKVIKNPNADLYLVTSSFEGGYKPQLIIDLIQKASNIVEIPESLTNLTFYYQYYDAKPYDWTNDGVVLNYFSKDDVEDVTSKVENGINFYMNQSDVEKIAELEKLNEEAIKKLGNYEKVHCELNPSNQGQGSLFGCLGYRGISSLSYSSDLGQLR